LRKNAAHIAELGYISRAVNPLQLRSSRFISASFGLAGLLSIVAVQACSGATTDDSPAASGGAAASGGSQASSGGASAGGGAAGGSTAAAGGAAAGGAAAGGAAACDINKILNANCSATTCHGVAAKETPPTAAKPPTTSDLDLFVADVEGAILNKPATYKGVDKSKAANPDACPTTAQLLVDPAGLETSLMWMKVTKTHSCGDEMPNGVKFDEVETACYKSWLEDMINK
jgi:hypothetical protein